MNILLLKLQLLLKAELALAKAEARRRTRQGVMMALSLIFLGLGLVFVNIGLYQEFADAMLNARAAFTVAAINLAFAAVPALLVRLDRPNPEEQAIQAFRDLAWQELSQQGKQWQDQAKGVSQLLSLAQGKGGNALALAPLLALLTRLLKKRAG
ncbi:hypothetical protein [Ferrimonas marina]|uniref:Holin-X, holin superfamily III n=1 Tax=Ferrimonas marina TaxID=299255 RepID=A0A1M5NY32_9GAMM|nr:hypothetical protein [Ferrimonas marina]SHG94431.1 hypothetical protein SAMN02745129_1220 [Ferrimonas marina]